MIKQIRELLKEWLDFPAYMGITQTPYQFYVNDFDVFISTYNRNLNRDMFLSTHSTSTRDKNMFNKVFFDMDNDNLHVAFSDTLKFVDYLENSGYNTRVVFSANKGFHVYIDFDYVIIDNYAQKIDMFINDISNKLSINSFDVQVCKDKNRIMRVPFTINTKSGKMCYPIDIHNFDIDNPSFTIYNKKKSNGFADYLNGLEIKEHQYSKLDDVVKVNDFEYIMNNAEYIKDGRMNLVWKILIPSMIQLKYSDIRILKVVKEFFMRSYGDYTAQQKNFALYYLKRTREHGFFPMRLDRFRAEYEMIGI